jgi:hypothetical protein
MTSGVITGVPAAKEQPATPISDWMRARRMRAFDDLINRRPRPIRILDIGGTTSFWESRGWAGREEYQIVTVNLQKEERRYHNIEPRSGDATDLREYGDRSFDVAFSNSVIEHLFTYEKQAAMAAEVQRVGSAYWVQTPNFWFPIEPHFQVPGWQWMPRSLRVAIVRRRRCGWRGPSPDKAQAEALVDEVRLLSGREMRSLFPKALLYKERFCGFVKSWVAYSGFGS